MFVKEDLETSGSVELAMMYHRRILDALTAHDAQTAETAMYDHLKTSIQNIERMHEREAQKLSAQE
jgi:DNA-binding FadR family transcriptional regulator